MSRNVNKKPSPGAVAGTPEAAASPKQPKPPMSRSDAARAAGAARRRKQQLRRLAVGALGLAVIGGFLYYRARSDAALPGQAVSQMASRHIAVGDPTPRYDTDPPTSGPHVPEPASWGVYTEPLDKPAMVHSLEDGGVVISYRPDLDRATLDQLTTLAKTYTTDLILAPYPGLSHPIVLTAWGRIDRLDTLDEARIRQFADAWRGKDHHGDSGS